MITNINKNICLLNLKFAIKKDAKDTIPFEKQN